MTRLGPDDRPGFKNVEVVAGYDHWAPTYEGEPNPLIRVEEPLTLALIGDYWRIFGRLGMRVEEILEPKVEGWLADEFPYMRQYEGIPFALILKARKPQIKSVSDADR